MSREYLFRGFVRDKSGSKTITMNGEKIQGEWRYGDLVHSWKRNNTKPDIKIANTFGEYEVIPETIGQCAEMRDIEKKKAFEGDIISISWCVKDAFNLKDGVIIYQNGCFFVEGNGGSLLSTLNAIADSCFILRGRIIGNIFENPDLLKEENDE